VHNALGLGHIGAVADGHRADTDFRNLEAAAAQTAILYNRSFTALP
jgi:hypothetical protein